MPFIPALNTAKVVLVQKLHDQVVTNTIYVEKTEGWDEATLTQVAGTVRDWWEDHLDANVSANLSLESIIARDMTTEEGLGIEIVPNPILVGGIVGQAAPGNVALAVKLITNYSGRNRRGRVFQAGIAEDDTEGNQIKALRRDPLVLAYMELRTAITALGHTWVVASFYDGMENSDPIPPHNIIKRVPIPRATALLTPVTNIKADLNFDSQRRRLHGRGK